MVQIRQRDGSVSAADKSVAVEILDNIGRLAVVITQSASGAINILTPGDPIFNGYANIHNLKQSKVAVHEPFNGQPVKI